MVWGWTVFHGALALLALLSVWRTHYAAAGASLVAVIAITVAAVIPFPGAEHRGAINAIAEVPVLVVAALLLIESPRVGFLTLVLTVVSIVMSVAFSYAENRSVLGLYNVSINLVLDARCIMLICIGIANVVADRTGDLFRVPDCGRAAPLCDMGVRVATKEGTRQ